MRNFIGFYLTGHLFLQALVLNGVTNEEVEVRIVHPPGKLNGRAGPYLAYISILAFSWFSVGCCIFAFFGVFLGHLGF